jgi:hypothetical protein
MVCFNVHVMNVVNISLEKSKVFFQRSLSCFTTGLFKDRRLAAADSKLLMERLQLSGGIQAWPERADASGRSCRSLCSGSWLARWLHFLHASKCLRACPALLLSCVRIAFECYSDAVSSGPVNFGAGAVPARGVIGHAEGPWIAEFIFLQYHSWVFFRSLSCQGNGYNIYENMRIIF